MNIIRMVLPVFLLLLGGTGLAQHTVLVHDPDSAPISFAADEIRRALAERGHDVSTLPLNELEHANGSAFIVLATATHPAVKNTLQTLSGEPLEDLKPEGFEIRVSNIRNGNGTLYRVVGADIIGAMYGGLELAEWVALEGLESVQNQIQNPYLEKRGLKINIPLDARTPSYADAGSAAQANIPEMWSMEFWTRHLDSMARNRYNAITLWSLHPFPSLVKVPGYEKAALDDVKRANFDFWTWFPHYHTQGSNMYGDHITDNLETLKTIRIEDKIRFWRDVMQYAHDRGIEFYLITWNVFVTSAADAGYGITDRGEAVTKDYLRKSVQEVFQTYPLLKGIGVTAGENMHHIDDKIGWLADTYGEGLKDAMREETNPDREFEFIQRFWWADRGMQGMKDAYDFEKEVEFNYSHKYAQARLYKETRPTAIGNLPDELPDGCRFWLNLRNDDIFNFRWGDPDYVRDFINNMPSPDKLKGFHMGSDGYVWGREFTSTEPESPRQLEMEKHWYRFLLWGRLGYDNTIPNSRFEKIMGHRFPQVSASELMDVWAEASRIIPKINRTDSEAWDFQWAVEYSRNKDHVVTEISGSAADANELRRYAKRVLAGVAALRGAGGKELRLTLGDLEAMAYLGLFYAEKMDGTDSGAAAYWRAYAALASSQYKPQLLGRAGRGDWKLIYESFDEQPESVPATAGGTIFEAEKADLTHAQIKTTTKGSTGDGYVVVHAESAGIEWHVDAPQAGEYILEIRYALSKDERGDVPVSINGVVNKKIDFWSTGGSEFWAWDRIVVDLQKGSNTIKIEIRGIHPKVDHLNVLYAGGDRQEPRMGITTHKDKNEKQGN